MFSQPDKLHTAKLQYVYCDCDIGIAGASFNTLANESNDLFVGNLVSRICTSKVHAWSITKKILEKSRPYTLENVVM